jgi:hypothetical protein
MKKYTTKQLKALTLFVTVVGLFGFILCRKNVAVSFTLQGLATVSAISYCLIKTDEELNPLSEAWKELEEERERINQQYTKDCQQFDEDRERLKLENAELLQEQKEYFLAEQKRVVDLYEHELDLYIEQLQLKEDLLRKAKLPKLASGISRTEYYANKIISYLFENGIDCDFADSWEESTHDLIRLIPKNGTTKRDLEKHSEALQLELRLSNAPTFEIVQGCIQLRLDTRLVETVQKEKKSKLSLVVDEWLPDVIAKVIHLKLDGETQSGKSTAVANICSVLSTIYKDAEFISIDPKYPLSLAGIAPEALATWQRIPKYPRIENALAGLQELADTVRLRLELAGQDIAAGKPIRKFPKIVFVVDEIDWIALEYSKEAIDLLQVGLKVGAALNVVVLYLGQTPRCSKLKMTKDDFRNSTNISLGSNIPDALETYIFDEEYKRELLELYWSEMNKGNVYICLVSQKGKKPFLAKLPEPGLYKPLLTVNSGKRHEVNNDKPINDDRLYPELTPVEELSLWNELKETLSTQGKTYVIEERLSCKGKYYKKGSLYLDYLSSKYG